MLRKFVRNKKNLLKLTLVINLKEILIEYFVNMQEVKIFLTLSWIANMKKYEVTLYVYFLNLLTKLRCYLRGYLSIQRQLFKDVSNIIFEVNK